MPRIETNLYLVQGTPPAKQTIDRDGLNKAIYRELPSDTSCEVNIIPSPRQPPSAIRQYLNTAVSRALAGGYENSMAVINIDGLEEGVVDCFVEKQIEETQEARTSGEYVPKIIVFENEGILEWGERFIEAVNSGVLKLATNYDDLVTEIVSLLQEVEGRTFEDNYGEDDNDDDDDDRDDADWWKG